MSTVSSCCDITCITRIYYIYNQDITIYIEQLVITYVSGTVQAACGGPNAPLSFEGAAWNSSTVAVIAAAKAHTEMVLLQVRWIDQSVWVTVVQRGLP
jgi:hypothetical protein